MAEDVVFHKTFPYKQRCDLCGRSANHMYQINKEGNLLNFDSTEHARIGLKNWDEKKAKGIKPETPYKEENLDVLEDTTEEM